ncbi:carboxypeptidase regulatory-like domain-containing protein [Microvirga sp. BT689]|uniref:carboxypeptidase-like regulatory domain-containing protein n=1 Tax=Microvirga arvi TaxID=2778731 RepID=UPI001950A211|nr:carboxypeptidase-like regulatory domain-containing protein [Microvirga arvi]MBM6583136.1 carboxypeptidase regulatory-like domain-containing protein [Microvirga arvi]
MSSGVVQQHASADITISGVVRDYEGSPINAIKVSVYRDTDFVEKAFSDENGRYEVSISPGKPVIVWFDTHPTLIDADKWHPSVVSSVSTQASVSLDRSLGRVGHSHGVGADLDALAAYQFAAMFIEHDPGSIFDLYPALAQQRMSQLKVPTQILQKVHTDIVKFFQARAEDHT